MVLLDRDWLKTTIQLLATDGYAVVGMYAEPDAKKVLAEVQNEIVAELRKHKPISPSAKQ